MIKVWRFRKLSEISEPKIPHLVEPDNFIEYTDDVKRKLELFDEAVVVIRKYKEQVHITGHGISPEESWAAKTFLKKL